MVSFPLYTEAIKFFHHEEGMVRIAVRTITLSVYNGESRSTFCFLVKFVISLKCWKLSCIRFNFYYAFSYLQTF